MTEGLADLLPQLFEDKRVHRIVASIQPHNTRSRNLAARLGFRYEGTAVSSLRLADGTYSDVEYWALTEDDNRAKLEA
jgi:ribosomal-protein-alanine N-acetyltransferase